MYHPQADDRAICLVRTHIELTWVANQDHLIFWWAEKKLPLIACGPRNWLSLGALICTWWWTISSPLWSWLGGVGFGSDGRELLVNAKMVLGLDSPDSTTGLNLIMIIIFPGNVCHRIALAISPDERNTCAHSPIWQFHFVMISLNCCCCDLCYLSGLIVLSPSTLFMLIIMIMILFHSFFF